MDPLTVVMKFKRSTPQAHVFESYDTTQKLRGQVYIKIIDMPSPAAAVEITAKPVVE